MIDYFALLCEPRRPWLDPDSLKEKFLSLSAEAHPDRVHNASAAEKRAAQERYMQFNAAYNCLRDPRERLRHLLELERGAKPKEVQQIPPDLMSLFLEIGRLCRETDAFLAEKSGITSPLLKVQMFERGQEWADKLAALQQEINSRRNHLDAELRNLDAEWEAGVESNSFARNALFERLEDLCRLFSYYERWRGQIQERIVQLAF